MQESLVLTDLSQRDKVVEVLRSLEVPATGSKVEIALDYPGQQLAVDLYARTQDDLDVAVAKLKAALAAQGIRSRTASEIDADLLHRASA